MCIIKVVMISLGILFFESPYECGLPPPANRNGGPFSKGPVIFLSDRPREVVFFLFSAFTSKIKALLVLKFKWLNVRKRNRMDSVVFELHSHYYSLDLYFEICFGSVK